MEILIGGLVAAIVVEMFRLERRITKVETMLKLLVQNSPSRKGEEAIKKFEERWSIWRVRKK